MYFQTHKHYVHTSTMDMYVMGVKIKCTIGLFFQKPLFFFASVLQSLCMIVLLLKPLQTYLETLFGVEPVNSRVPLARPQRDVKVFVRTN